jgi:SAM-dependent methyltransferase
VNNTDPSGMTGIESVGNSSEQQVRSGIADADGLEPALVAERYERRKNLREDLLYSPLNPSVYMALQEKERATIRWINRCGIAPVDEKRVLEVGCGSGGNLLRLLRLGFRPENMYANELLDYRVAEARRFLPGSVSIYPGDASELELPEGSFDVVHQSTVFTSILDPAFQHKLADKMWSLVKPGGGVLWYDFTFDNPANPDVKGVSPNRIRQLFPEGRLKIWRTTLAPPISRRVTRISPSLYTIFNAIPALRTHILCWIEKPRIT